ncbi:hypothetical protein AKJ45_02170 [candidate division MSBL1 archaeon SCGC-AAA261F19]|uniref:Threonyl-tRNA synthetase editing domain-containing protein n=1 Tax=candidate division MSBL1 archaeon SCGC-AAA261F19 TaxID=1698275 RepID=A0A133VA10_9EURY|nr:hypothetical protein AKJ45_02170 [candidate division MSBL1 archaeon SCGC-AAA261F19]
MKFLFVHADYVSYEVKQKSKVAEEIDDAHRKGRMENPLIVFLSVEERDENSEKNAKPVDRALGEIKDIASKIKVKNVALFPFAHLSESLASPDYAISVLKELETELEKSEFNLLRVPFGWYKEFEFRSKGHPLSVLSRAVRS